MTDLIILPPLILGVITYGFTLWKASFVTKEKVASFLAILSSGLSFIFALLSLSQRGIKTSYLPEWILFGDLKIELTYYLDAWSLTLALVSSFLTLVIIVFSRYYFGVNSHAAVYYGMIQMFLFGMLMLVLSNNLIFTFLGWEIVGICSWFLIGIYHYKGGLEGRKAAYAGQKAMLVTGLADVGFLMAIALLGVNNFSISSMQSIPDIVAIGLLVAAFGKSAQFPLHIWISSTDDRDIDAMQGPTTISALIHAATMVNAGVYLTSRVVAIGTSELNTTVILWVGITSAIYAGLSALGTSDLKRVLAYSTISQLGFMFIALGVGSTFAALWHLTNHAFFKALLFLIAGYLIHTVGSRKLEDLTNTVRGSWLKISLIVGVSALAGVPFFSGFFSKDLILDLLVEKGDYMAFGFTLFAAFLTGAYSFKILRILLGSGEQQDQDKLIPRAVLLLLTSVVILSSLSYFYLNAFTWSKSYQIFSFDPLVLLGILVSIFGMLVGYYYDRIPRIAFFYELLKQGFYIDDILVGFGVVSVKGVSKLAAAMHNQTNFWNFVFFSLGSIGITIALYITQFGGYI